VSNHMMDMNDILVVGNTSQISRFLPISCDRISSRNIDFSSLGDYGKVFVCFAEQRTFRQESDFVGVNFDYTMSVIDRLLPKTDKIIYYSTSMLWENIRTYDINDEFSYNKSNNYLVSKEMATNAMKTIDKVSIHYPCNFNSSYRPDGYLFSKLIQACRGKTVSTGSLSFRREVTHASYVADRSYHTNESSILAPGFLVDVGKYFKDVLSEFGYGGEYLLEEVLNTKNNKNDSCHKSIDTSYDYGTLLRDTVEDIQGYISQ
jgi:nucleoside-diphosphate-sugar epimerase